MSTPPIAKEAEVTGLSEVREKLERALRDADPQDRISAGAAHDILVIAISEALALLESEQGEQEKRFPVLGSDGSVTIPWSVAEQAYLAYSGQYGRGQTLERLGQRGGFGASELDDLLPGWREMVWPAPSEQMRRDHEAMDVLREKPGDLMWFGMSDNSPPWHSYVRNQMTENQPSRKRPAHDPTDAILGTESENGADDE